LRLRAIALLVCACLIAAPNVVAASPTPGLIHAVVTFHSGIPASFQDELEARGVEGAMAFGSIRSVTLAAPIEVLEDLQADPRVRQVRAQRRLEFLLYGSVEQIGAQGVESGEAYDFGGTTQTRPGVTGEGSTVAVVDTGIWEGHPDLFGKVLDRLNFEYQYAYPVFTPEQRDIAFTATGPHAIADGWGHGTHVAGIVAGTGMMAAGRENHGAAPGADLVSLKIGDLHNGFPQDAGWETNAIAALDWVLRHHDDERFGPNGIRIVNNSWTLMAEDLLFGVPQYDPLADLIRQMAAEGIINVFAAGNSGGAGVVPVPNGMHEVITVANACKAIDSCGAGNIAGDSSRGPSVDVAAPGTDIISTYLPASLIGALKPFFGGSYGSTDEERAQNNAFYSGASGTSMAAPHVAGLVALLLEVNPALTPEQVRDILTTTADDAGPAGVDDAWGFGLVDTREALRLAHQMTLSAPTEDPNKPCHPNKPEHDKKPCRPR